MFLSLDDLYKAGIFKRKKNRLLTWEQVLKRDKATKAVLKSGKSCK